MAFMIKGPLLNIVQFNLIWFDYLFYNKKKRIIKMHKTSK